MKSIKKVFTNVEILHENKDKNKCLNLSKIEKGSIVKTERNLIDFSKVFNNCWGRSIAITKDEIVRPCIYSSIKICNLDELKKPGIIDKIEKYWYLTKDKVDKCKICELRYLCPDCREIAYVNSGGNLYASNPNCLYNPETGIWEEEKT